MSFLSRRTTIAIDLRSSSHCAGTSIAHNCYPQQKQETQYQEARDPLAARNSDSDRRCQRTTKHDDDDDEPLPAFLQEQLDEIKQLLKEASFDQDAMSALEVRLHTQLRDLEERLDRLDQHPCFKNTYNAGTGVPEERGNENTETSSSFATTTSSTVATDESITCDIIRQSLTQDEGDSTRLPVTIPHQSRQSNVPFQHLGPINDNIVETSQQIGRYVLGDFLGEGYSARVYKATMYIPKEQKNMSFAIKVIDKRAKRFERSSAVQNFTNELRALQSCQHHPNIVHFHEMIHTRKQIYVVQELANTDLFQLRGRTDVTLSSVRQVFLGVMHALDFLHHETGIAHLDIKAENILIKRDVSSSPLRDLRHTDVKLCDFGISRHTIDGLDPRSAPIEINVLCGTPGFFAPEMASSGRVCEARKADIWSTGVTLWEIVTGLPLDWFPSYDLLRKPKTPRNGPHHHKQGSVRRSFQKEMKRLVHYELHQSGRDFHDDDLHDFVCQMVTFDPDQRMSAHEAIEHPWLKE